MKILFLTPQPPYPPHKGTSMRNFYLMRSIALKDEVHLLSFVEGVPLAAEVEPLRQLCASLHIVLAPNRSLLGRLLSLFFSTLPDMALRYPSTRFATILAALLERERFDVVQAEGLELAQYMDVIKVGGLGRSPRYPAPIIVFDDHNAEYLLQLRAYRTEARTILRWPWAAYSFLQWRKLVHYEREACRQARVVIAVSEEDRYALLSLYPELEVAVVSNGIDTEYYSEATFETRMEGWAASRGLLPLVFTGSMDYRPNVDAMIWFCNRILPLIRREFPEVVLFIVGRSPAHSVRALASDHVIVTGEVDDVRPYLAQSKVYVVPMRIGGGVRFKVLEGMASGIPVVSTSVGVEGIEVTPGFEVLVADDADAFGAMVVELLRNPARGHQLATQARTLVRAHYDWRVITPRLEEIYQRLSPEGRGTGLAR